MTRFCQTLVFLSLVLSAAAPARGAVLIADEEMSDSLTDHEALAVSVTGSVQILRAGGGDWQPLAEGDTVYEGDEIITDEEAGVELALDDSLLNITRIDEDTVAEIRSLEPTMIYLRDGGVYSELRALVSDTTYEVGTVTSVIAVRGTEFLKLFDAETGNDDTVVSDGTVEAALVRDDGSVVPEPVRVEKGNALTVSPDVIRNTPAAAIQARPVPPKLRERLERQAANARENLERFAGGARELLERRAQSARVIAKPAVRAVIEKRMKNIARGQSPGFGRDDRRRSGGPDGPGGPNGPGNVNGPNARGPRNFRSDSTRNDRNRNGDHQSGAFGEFRPGFNQQNPGGARPDRPIKPPLQTAPKSTTSGDQ